MCKSLLGYLCTTCLVLNVTTGISLAQQEESDSPPPEKLQTLMIQSEDISDDEGSGTHVLSFMAVSDDGPGSAPLVFSTGMGSGQMTMIPGPEFASNPTDLLNHPSVQKDLELVEEQQDRLREINREFSRHISEEMAKFKNGPNGFDVRRFKEIQPILAELTAQKRAQIESVLLPHQLDRLKQVALQMNMKSRGTARALQSELAKELDITEEQVQRLKEREKQLNQELQEKIKQWKEEARKELLEELTPQQRTKLNQLLGDKFETDINDFHPQAKH